MKNKNSLVLWLMVLIVALNMCICISCEDEKGKGDVTIVIACDGSNKEYYVDAEEIEEEGLLPVLLYLKEKKELHLVYSESTYGVYITEIGNFKEGKGNYVYLYTSVAKDADVSEYRRTVEYNGKTLISAGVGLSQMSVEQGAVIYVGVISY